MPTSPVLDISLPLSPTTTRWPGSEGFSIESMQHLARGDNATSSIMRADVHSGTHIDAPSHAIVAGADINELDLEVFVGGVVVVDVGDAEAIDAQLLEDARIPPAERILLRTRNSQLWSNTDHDFCEDYVGLTLDAADWVVARGVRLLGTDYLSVQRFRDSRKTHEVLLRGGVALLEGLDLSAVEPGRYTIVCLPLRIVGAEASPARAVLLPPDGALG